MAEDKLTFYDNKYTRQCQKWAKLVARYDNVQSYATAMQRKYEHLTNINVKIAWVMLIPILTTFVLLILGIDYPSWVGKLNTVIVVANLCVELYFAYRAMKYTHSDMYYKYFDHHLVDFAPGTTFVPSARVFNNCIATTLDLVATPVEDVKCELRDIRFLNRTKDKMRVIYAEYYLNPVIRKALLRNRRRDSATNDIDALIAAKHFVFAKTAKTKKTNKSHKKGE